MLLLSYPFSSAWRKTSVDCSSDNLNVMLFCCGKLFAEENMNSIDFLHFLLNFQQNRIKRIKKILICNIPAGNF